MDKKTKLIFISGILGILLIFLSSFWGSGNGGKDEFDEDIPLFSAEEYAYALSLRLEDIIVKIDGAGKAFVMITMENNGENIYKNSIKADTEGAKEYDGENEKRDSNKKSIDETAVIIDTGNGKTALQITRLEPVVRGVVVVCEGAGNPVVREDVTNAVTTALGIECRKVAVVRGIDN